MRTWNFAKLLGVLGVVVLVLGILGCQTETQPGATSEAKAAAPAKPAVPEVVRPTIRIKAGTDSPVTDSQGVVWMADTGFDGGTPVDRPELQVTGTTTPELYHAERYGMDSYNVKVPNGKYLVKLHFSEDYEGIATPGDRVFTFAVKDGTAKEGKVIKEVKDFSPWKASGAQFKAYVETVPMDVTQGEITVTFTAQVENPQINALEVVPE